MSANDDFLAKGNNLQQYLSKLEHMFYAANIPFEKLAKSYPLESKTIMPKQELLGQILAVQKSMAGNSSVAQAFQSLCSNEVVMQGVRLYTTHQKIHEYLQKVRNDLIVQEKLGEDEEHLLASAKEWGRHGWTLATWVNIDTFFIQPQSQEQADSIIMNDYSLARMEEYWENIRKLSFANIDDLEESIFCFLHEKYKSCAMILFAMLDGQMISLQREEDRKNRGYRPSGKGAGENIIQHAKDEYDLKTLPHVLLSLNMIDSCISNVFKNGDDFKEEPPIINRHFISHGQLKRKVTKKDCIQLFLLCYNFFSFLQKISLAFPKDFREEVNSAIQKADAGDFASPEELAALDAKWNYSSGE